MLGVSLLGEQLNAVQITGVVIVAARAVLMTARGRGAEADQTESPEPAAAGRTVPESSEE
jgi:hypothetical protein